MSSFEENRIKNICDICHREVLPYNKIHYSGGHKCKGNIRIVIFIDEQRVREAIEKVKKKYGWDEVYAKEIEKELGLDKK